MKEGKEGRVDSGGSGLSVLNKRLLSGTPATKIMSHEPKVCTE